MRDVAVLGVGMHPWGKFADRSVTDLCRHAVVEALADAGVGWRDIEAVAAASSRFSGWQGLGPQRQRHRGGHGLHRDPGVQHVGGMCGRWQRLQRRLLDGGRRPVRHGRW